MNNAISDIMCIFIYFYIVPYVNVISCFHGYQADILASKGQLLEKAGYHRPQPKAWEGLNDLTCIYGLQPFLEPAVSF